MLPPSSWSLLQPASRHAGRQGLRHPARRHAQAATAARRACAARAGGPVLEFRAREGSRVPRVRRAAGRRGDRPRRAAARRGAGARGRLRDLPQRRRLRLGRLGRALPAVYGHEAAGVVEAVGGDAGRPRRPAITSSSRSCARAAPATSACAASRPCARRASRSTSSSPLRTPSGAEIAQGLRTAAFAEEVLVHRSQVVPIPRELPLDRACLLACGVVTGYGAVVNTAQVTRGRQRRRDRRGRRGPQLHPGRRARRRRRRSSRSTWRPTGSRSRRRSVRRTRSTRPPRTRARAVRDLTEGRGVDCALVAAGATTAVELGAAARAPRRHGRDRGHAGLRCDGRDRARRDRPRRHPHPGQQARLVAARGRRAATRRALPRRAACGSTSSISSRSPLDGDQRGARSPPPAARPCAP